MAVTEKTILERLRAEYELLAMLESTMNLSPQSQLIADAIAEIERLRIALEEIADPMNFMRREAEETGRILTGDALLLAINGYYLGSIARRALGKE